MGVVAFVTGRSAALDQAEAELKKEEEEVFQTYDDEITECPAHTRRDMPRFRLLKNRQNFHSAKNEARSDRNLILTLGGFVLVYVKLYGGDAAVGKLLSGLVKVLGL